MFEQIIFDKLWLVLPLWLVIYISDYYLTIIGARYYNAGAKDHIVFGGSYELTPEFQEDIDALRMFSPKFLRALLISSAVFSFLWYVSRDSAAALFFFRFLCGGLIVSEAAILMRHAQNIALFRMAKAHRGLSGQIRYEEWFGYRMSHVDLLCFAGMFGFIFLLSGSVPFLGGALLTMLTAKKHSRLGKETETESQPDITELCARCKKPFPSAELRTLSELGMKLMALGHMGLPEDERTKRYCPRCRASQNRGVVFLAVLSVISLVIYVITRFGSG